VPQRITGKARNHKNTVLIEDFFQALSPPDFGEARAPCCQHENAPLARGALPRGSWRWLL
jgi:hypothetical protein